jgi:hypothetical protein
MNTIKKIDYIYEHMDNLNIDDRKILLKIIYDSECKKHIIEKPSGCEIRLSKLSPSVIDILYNTMEKKISEYSTDIAQLI